MQELQENNNHYKIPEGLYIPPEALQVTINDFQGPLDLLLYLIKKQNINILDIPIVEVVKQYSIYIEMMKNIQIEIASDYLVMAALLAEIKSKMLIPKTKYDLEEEEDPRIELVKKLQEYEAYKNATDFISELPREERDIFVSSYKYNDNQLLEREEVVNIDMIVNSFKDILIKASLNKSHRIKLEKLSIKDRMNAIILMIKNDCSINFSDLFCISEGKMGVVVSFISLLELYKQRVILIKQDIEMGQIIIEASKNE